MNSRVIHLNQDDAAFYRHKPLSEMSVAGLEALVDFYAQGTQLGGLAFCVNMQRALFPSRTWETLPADTSTGEWSGLAELRRKGIDQFEVWLRRARHHGVGAFLSMRMNDCHGLEGHGDWWRHRKKGEDQEHYRLHATDFWKRNPQFRRAAYRYERSFESAFDYAHPEVREHHLKLIAEVLERYDLDGLELDWMRWIFCFAPGGEAAGRAILTGFMQQVHALRLRAEQRLGHRVLLRHRIPAEPEACDALGFDVPAWRDAGAVDEIILSAFGGCANFDYPIPLWRRLLGRELRILALAEATVSAFPGASANDYHFQWGAASAALERGADGIYLFNECYRETGSSAERRLLLEMLSSLGSPATLERRARRYAVTYSQVNGPGRPAGPVLPIPLANAVIGASIGRLAETITLRMPIGRRAENSRYVLRLGFSRDTPSAALDSMPVWVNTRQVMAGAPLVYEDLTAAAFPQGGGLKIPEAAAVLREYEIPWDALCDDVNVVEFQPRAVSGGVTWAEILAAPW